MIKIICFGLLFLPLASCGQGGVSGKSGANENLLIQNDLDLVSTLVRGQRKRLAAYDDWVEQGKDVRELVETIGMEQLLLVETVNVLNDRWKGRQSFTLGSELDSGVRELLRKEGFTLEEFRSSYNQREAVEELLK